MSPAGNFDERYRRWRASRSHAALLGEDMPAEIASFSFVPLDGLGEVAALLGLRPGQVLVDLGCGRGGPGLWLAQHSRAALIGIDSSGVAICDACQRRGLFPGTGPAQFLAADVARTPLRAGSADAIVSIDVLQLLADHPAFLAETARLARPGGRVVLTTWMGQASAPARFPRDLAALASGAGLTVEVLTDRPAWLARQYRIYEKALRLDGGDRAAADLAAADGAAADLAVADLAREGRNWENLRSQVHRVVLAARRDS